MLESNPEKPHSLSKPVAASGLLQPRADGVIGTSMHDDLYKRFTEARPATESIGRIMPYNWTGMANRLVGEWMVYSSMLDDFAREAANAINAFTINVRRLYAWAAVLDTLGEDERAEVIHEFIDPTATLCLLTPYAVRSRLIFATAHLCHQVNLVREVGWMESSLPADDEIWMDSADRQGAPWRRYNRLKTRIEAIGGQRLRKATADFRNAFTHRFSPRVETGITNVVKRHFDPATGSAYYSFGGTEPLAVSDLTVLLDAELSRCYAAFEAFQTLVAEQVAFVAAKNTEMLTEIDALSGATRSAGDQVEP